MVDRIANALTLLFFILWGIAYGHWGWNGWIGLIFALTCIMAVTILVAQAVGFYAGQTGTDISEVLGDYREGQEPERKKWLSERNLLGKVCKNSACRAQNGWGDYRCWKCARFLGL